MCFVGILRKKMDLLAIEDLSESEGEQEEEEEFVEVYKSYDELEEYEEDVGFDYDLYQDSGSEDETGYTKRVENLLSAITALNDLEAENISDTLFTHQRSVILESLSIDDAFRRENAQMEQTPSKISDNLKTPLYTNVNIQISGLAELSSDSDDDLSD
jgi:hypothetical protein